MAKLREHVSRAIDWFEPKLSLVIHAGALMASFTLPAWAVKSAQVFAQYGAVSWVVAGFAGVLIAVVVRLLWNWATRIGVRAKYDKRFIEHGGDFNPLDLIFEKRRIYLNDFALPSHPYIEGKTFVDCDIIGPANVYWAFGNQANPLRPPVMDAVCLDPGASFTNGFIFQNCIFRNCSFQRITVFAGTEFYPEWKNNKSLNIISVIPSAEQIAQRERLVNPPPAGTSPVIEHVPTGVDPASNEPAKSG
ncbi:MAG: hypothetical protein E6G97_15750 [Alphaproteobacteria bacterium]|nr:MAG: hypothetical protein E6G97_15750 [Alphaproteobacteria bacterium]